MRQALAVNRNHTNDPTFEREGKSDATEQGAGVEGCDPAHMHRGRSLSTPTSRLCTCLQTHIIHPLSSCGDRG